jgi:co-chaperonin GroES (HSP10)
MMMTEATEVVTEEDLEQQLPKPVGYKLLIALPTIEKTYESGIIKADKTVFEEQILSTIGLVLDIGDQAYIDPVRYPNGPWCKVGDYVMFRTSTGTRFKIDGAEYRLMNDDSIEAVVAKPRGISRA